jgi:hypothetical protein
MALMFEGVGAPATRAAVEVTDAIARQNDPRPLLEDWFAIAVAPKTFGADYVARNRVCDSQ